MPLNYMLASTQDGRSFSKKKSMVALKKSTWNLFTHGLLEEAKFVRCYMGVFQIWQAIQCSKKERSSATKMKSVHYYPRQETKTQGANPPTTPKIGNPFYHIRSKPPESKEYGIFFAAHRENSTARLKMVYKENPQELSPLRWISAGTDVSKSKIWIESKYFNLKIQILCVNIYIRGRINQLFLKPNGSDRSKNHHNSSKPHQTTKPYCAKND